jgi:hypothetical protein
MTICQNCHEPWFSAHLVREAWLETMDAGDTEPALGRTTLLDALEPALSEYGSAIATALALEAMAFSGSGWISPWPYVVGHGHGCPSCGVAGLSDDECRWLVARLWRGVALSAEHVQSVGNWHESPTPEASNVVDYMADTMGAHILRLSGTDFDHGNVAIVIHGDVVALGAFDDGLVDPHDVGWSHGWTFGYPLIWLSDGAIRCEKCAPTPLNQMNEMVWRLGADDALTIGQRTDSEAGWYVDQTDDVDGLVCDGCHEYITEPAPYTVELASAGCLPDSVERYWHLSDAIDAALSLVRDDDDDDDDDDDEIRGPSRAVTELSDGTAHDELSNDGIWSCAASDREHDLYSITISKY